MPLTAPTSETESPKTHARTKGVISNDQGQQVRIFRDSSNKTLTIDLAGEKPVYRFSGLWSGKDIRVIQRHLARAYYQHTRELRRERVGTKPTNPETNQEVNDAR